MTPAVGPLRHLQLMGQLAVGRVPVAQRQLGLRVLAGLFLVGVAPVLTRLQVGQLQGRYQGGAAQASSQVVGMYSEFDTRSEVSLLYSIEKNAEGYRSVWVSMLLLFIDSITCKRPLVKAESSFRLFLDSMLGATRVLMSKRLGRPA